MFCTSVHLRGLWSGDWFRCSYGCPAHGGRSSSSNSLRVIPHTTQTPRLKSDLWSPAVRSKPPSVRSKAITLSLEANLATDLEASREQFATCCQPHGNREGPTFLPVSIGRRESRPSCWQCWSFFSPAVVFAKDRSSRLFFLQCHSGPPPHRL